MKHFYLLLSLFLFASCETYEQDIYSPRYVVQGYLSALEPLPRISLSTDMPLNSTYNLQIAAVKDAQMEVQLLNASGQVEKSFGYVADSDSVSLYKPLDVQTKVLPNRVYALKITFPNKPNVITAQTSVPDTFVVKRVNAKQFVYQATTQPEFTYSQSLNARGQSYFVASVSSLDPKPNQLVPIWDPKTTSIQPVKEGLLLPPNPYSSPILNEKNYKRATDGSITIPLPWITIVYFGKNRVTTHALDDATYDYFRSQSVQQGGGTLAPGEIPNAISNVKGGTGIFGSFAKATADIEVIRN